jgi:hypothetical protein
VHVERKESLVENLIADKALKVIKKNYAAYTHAKSLAVPRGDPDAVVDLVLLEQSNRINYDMGNSEYESLMDCFTRMELTASDLTTLRTYITNDSSEQTKEDRPVVKTRPRRILMRFHLDQDELEAAIGVYKNDAFEWDSGEYLRACWCLARADGAFEIDRVSNDAIPEAFLKPKELLVYSHMQRQAHRYFSLDHIPAGKLEYAPCSGFQKTGCTLDVDFVSDDTAYVVRGGMWISSSYDAAYIQGYAAVARENGRAITRISVLYLQHGGCCDTDIHDWDHAKLLQFLVDTKGEEINACDLGLCETVPGNATEEVAKNDKKANRRKEQNPAVA